jgi:hypothetical protein
VRFEDLMLSLNDTVQEIVKFYGMAFDDKIAGFLKTHSSGQPSSAYSTFRNSSAVPFMWTKKLPFAKVKRVQENCREAMELWGYKEAKNSAELKGDFNPILPFDDFE